MPLASRLTPQRIESSPTIGDSARPASKFLAATSCQVASSQPDGKCSGRRPPEAPRTSPSTACRNDSATIVGRVSCPRAIVKIVFTSRLEWLFRHFSGMQAFGTVYHRKCQNVLGFLLTLPVANVQCRFSERRKSVSPEFSRQSGQNQAVLHPLMVIFCDHPCSTALFSLNVHRERLAGTGLAHAFLSGREESFETSRNLLGTATTYVAQPRTF